MVICHCFLFDIVQKISLKKEYIGGCQRVPFLSNYIASTYLENEFSFLVLFRHNKSSILQKGHLLSVYPHFACYQPLELTYFHPRVAEHLPHRISRTVCNPVVMCLSSASPRVILTTCSKRKALPDWPLKFWKKKMGSDSRKLERTQKLSISSEINLDQDIFAHPAHQRIDGSQMGLAHFTSKHSTGR